jgi:hypothetical protein
MEIDYAAAKQAHQHEEELHAQQQLRASMRPRARSPGHEPVISESVRERVRLALDVKVILTPPYIFH